MSVSLKQSRTVTTSLGDIEGYERDGILEFWGVPYAKPPFGPRRFSLPVPVHAWSGSLQATHPSPVAPQTSTIPFLGESLPLGSPAWGEDCLSLNIATPEAGSAGLPVMVYIHGGSYVVGAGSEPRLNPVPFARDGVVCITINYRLGVDGFLSLPDTPENLGLHDQLEALRWVQRHVHAFGGDPQNVTVFGNSAGAGSIAAIAQAAAEEGLFRRAIVQSAPLRLISDQAQARDLSRRVLADLGLSHPTDVSIPELLSRLQDCNERFRDTTRWDPYSYSLTPFMPTVDGDTVLTAELPDLVPSDVDLLVGSNRDEGLFFVRPPKLLETADPHLLTRAADEYQIPSPCRSAAARLDPEKSSGEALSELVTDQVFRGPAVELALGHAASGGRTYAYEFAWSPSNYPGARHALELPFVFDRLDADDAPALLGPVVPHQLAAAMRRSWVAFATNGDPGWPRYENRARSVMVFDTESTVQSDPREAHRSAWDASATSGQRTKWVASAARRG